MILCFSAFTMAPLGQVFAQRVQFVHSDGSMTMAFLATLPGSERMVP